VVTPDKQTISVREQDVAKQWWVVDAEGQTVGRLASAIARILRGKHKPLFTPRPERVLEHAVLGMLPKNRLGRRIGKKLHIYAGDQHPHAAQKPQSIAFKTK
jgi:large subunit ribosomal protein L13